MLDVTLISSPSLLVINIFSPSLDVTLETATYNCPNMFKRLPLTFVNCQRKGDSHLKIHSQLHNFACKERNNKSMHRK